MEQATGDFQSLVRRVREGSEDAAWELVDQYGDSIRRAVRRVLNERLRSKFDSLDFVQVVWNSLFRVRDKLDRFDRPEELAAYLVTMARNKVGMEVRRRLMTEKYNVGHEQSLDQLCRPEAARTFPAGSRRLSTWRSPASNGIACSKISRPIIDRSSICDCRGIPIRVLPTLSTSMNARYVVFSRGCSTQLPHDSGTIHTSA